MNDFEKTMLDTLGNLVNKFDVLQNDITEIKQRIDKIEKNQEAMQEDLTVIRVTVNHDGDALENMQQFLYEKAVIPNKFG